jgi:hypothetical protein
VFLPDLGVHASSYVQSYMHLHKEMRNSKAQYFLGDKFCTEFPGTVSSGTSGSLERMAHSSVHIWAGDPGRSTLANDGQDHSGADTGFLGNRIPCKAVMLLLVYTKPTRIFSISLVSQWH